LTIFTCTTLSAQVWDGGGDGTSWNDALNWSNDTIPLAGATVTFDINTSAVVTGTAPNAIRRIIFDTLSTVTLDLDLDLEVSGNPVHVINVKKDSKVTFGGTTDMRTFNLETGMGRNAFLLSGVATEVTITEQATININTCQNAIRSNKDDISIVNNGTINIVNYIEHGINIIKGTFDNNGTITIGTGMEDGAPTSDGINIDNNGMFNNNVNGTITVTQPLDNGVEILGVFNNAGTLSTIAKDDAIADNSGVIVGSTNIEGMLNNLASGIINTDGGIGSACRSFSVRGSGIFNNAGNLNVSAGNLGQSFFNLGTVTNEICAHINLIECRIDNNNSGMITNNGLITSSYTAAGVSHGAEDGSAINNAFYGYTNLNSDFTGGPVDGIDNGQNSSEGIVADAANSCTVTDIGIDVPYTWYTDMSGTVEAGTNDANGLLVLNDDIFPQNGNYTLYTCFGEAVQLNVENVFGDCALVNTVGVDFVELTDAFTLMPNPAQSFTQIKFGNEYITNKKIIQVYNAVGQLVKSANVNNADQYILHTSNLAAGIYTINLQTEKGMQIERLIVQK